MKNRGKLKNKRRFSDLLVGDESAVQSVRGSEETLREMTDDMKDKETFTGSVQNSDTQIIPENPCAESSENAEKISVKKKGRSVFGGILSKLKSFGTFLVYKPFHFAGKCFLLWYTARVEKRKIALQLKMEKIAENEVFAGQAEEKQKKNKNRSINETEVNFPEEIRIQECAYNLSEQGRLNGRECSELGTQEISEEFLPYDEKEELHPRKYLRKCGHFLGKTSLRRWTCAGIIVILFGGVMFLGVRHFLLDVEETSETVALQKNMETKNEDAPEDKNEEGTSENLVQGEVHPGQNISETSEDLLKIPNLDDSFSSFIPSSLSSEDSDSVSSEFSEVLTLPSSSSEQAETPGNMEDVNFLESRERVSHISETGTELEGKGTLPQKVSVQEISETEKIDKINEDNFLDSDLLLPPTDFTGSENKEISLENEEIKNLEKDARITKREEKGLNTEIIVPRRSVKMIPLNSLPRVNAEMKTEREYTLADSLAEMPYVESRDILAPPDFTVKEDMAEVSAPAKNLTDEKSTQEIKGINACDHTLPALPTFAHEESEKVKSSYGDGVSEKELNAEKNSTEILGVYGKREEYLDIKNSVKEKKISGDTVYVVQAGDNYLKISQKVYGTGSYARAIAQYNNIWVISDTLNVGTELYIPEKRFLEKHYPSLCSTREGISLHQLPRQSEAENENEKRMKTVPQKVPVGSYVVREGENLADIAKMQLGNASLWVELYQMNRETLGVRTENLPAGLKLRLPLSRQEEIIAAQPEERERRY